jgi:hypothetical protein
MLYLIEPQGRVQWTDFPASSAREAVEKHGADLARLEWRSDTEKRISPDVLKVALRHGLACSTGIAIEAIYLIDLHRAEELRQSLRAVQQSHEQLEESNGEFMERLLPGWKAEGRRLQAGIDQSTQESVEEAEENATALLDAPENPDLVAHWGRIGGLTY